VGKAWIFRWAIPAGGRSGVDRDSTTGRAPGGRVPLPSCKERRAAPLGPLEFRFHVRVAGRALHEFYSSQGRLAEAEEVRRQIE